MREFLKKNGITVIAAAVLVAVIAIASIALGGGSDASGSVVNTVMRPIRGVMSSIVSRLEDVYGYMYGCDSLEAENAALKARVAELERDYREYSEIADENIRLKKLIGFLEEHADYETTPAAVLSWSSSSWQSAFTIGKGSSSGLSIGNCVITESGFVVGRITSVSATSAVVTTLVDTTSNISAIVWDTDDSAVLRGDYVMMKEGVAKLSYLPDGSTLIPGSVVTTSGSGGVFPRGLVLGTVTAVHTDPSGAGDWAEVLPSAELNNLAYAYVITTFGEKE